MNQSQSNSPRKLQALLADDDIGIQLTMSALLQQKGYIVTTVGNGLEAIDASSNNVFNIILLDIRMPEMDGFEACKSIRELENGKNVPILMLTGQDDTDSIKKAFEVGATDFVAKPINYILLGFRIDYILRAANTAEELRKSQQRSNHAQRIANLGHIEWNLAHEIVHCSRGVREILLLPEQSAFTNFDNFINFVHPDDKDRVKSSIFQSLVQGDALNLEHRVVRTDGSIRFILQISEHRSNPKALDHMVITMQDITDRIDTEKRIHALAYYDDLTGLPNRSLLIQHLDRLLKAAMRFHHTTAVIVFGVDKFDKVLESLDQGSAENLIKMIAERIKNLCRESDLLSRQLFVTQDQEDISYQQLTAKLKNDEYVIVLSEISSLQAASVFLQRLTEQFRKAFQLKDREIYITTTAGISLAPIDGNSTNRLIKNAEIAKGFANKEGSANFRYFKQELNDRVTRNFSLANDLRKAVEKETLEVYYQPKVSLLDDTLVGVEALCRWNHPTMGAISPIEFIEIAEEEGLIGELGKWVLKTACNQLVKWKSEINCDFSVSVNISPKQLLDEQAMKRIVEFIMDSPISNHLVEFELTESTLLENFESSLNFLNKFIKMGCRLAIDDFGTGYSSLSYLGSLPANTLKIDQSFIRPIDSSNQYTAIVSGIIKLAHSLGMTVIAEGVETYTQKTILAQEHCDEIQGSLVSLALPPEDFTTWLKAWEVRKMNSDSDSDSDSDSENEIAGSVTQWH
ncbi:MAG: EAL domain-containing protein [Gammaproteobacteria bacterium]|nr:EAL domain-containing protein [Gammaproteobacteria bacterium]